MIGDMVISLIILFTSIYLYFAAGSIKQAGAITAFGAGFWPKTILVLLIILSLYQSVLSIIKFKQNKSHQGSVLAGKKEMVRTVFIVAGYILTIPFIGFILSSLLFAPIFLLNLGIRKVASLIGTPIALTGFLYLLFIKVMYIPLPRGVGIFRLFSLIFY